MDPGVGKGAFDLPRIGRRGDAHGAPAGDCGIDVRQNSAGFYFKRPDRPFACRVAWCKADKSPGKGAPRHAMLGSTFRCPTAAP
jgi:hypothetical protein